MATLGLTSTYNGQTVSTVAKDWITITGTYIETTLDTVQFTETAFFQAVYAFPVDVSIDSISYQVNGSLSAGGITAADFYVYGGNRGAISSSFLFSGPVTAGNFTLVGRVLTVDISVMGSPYTGTLPALSVNNPTFTVSYTELLTLHNLGINF